MQVACTINYGRKPLWKKRKKLTIATFSSVYLCALSGSSVDLVWTKLGSLTLLPQKLTIEPFFPSCTFVPLVVQAVCPLWTNLHSLTI